MVRRRYYLIPQHARSLGDTILPHTHNHFFTNTDTVGNIDVNTDMVLLYCVLKFDYTESNTVTGRYGLRRSPEISV